MPDDVIRRRRKKGDSRGLRGVIGGQVKRRAVQHDTGRENKRSKCVGGDAFDRWRERKGHAFRWCGIRWLHCESPMRAGSRVGVRPTGNLIGRLASRVVAGARFTEKHDLSVVLHAGLYKTGTTSLQCLAWMNRTQLMRQGIYIPMELSRRNAGAGSSVNSAHHLLYHRFRRAQTDRVIRNKLVRDIETAKRSARAQGCHTIVFMSELFSRMSVEELRQIEHDIVQQSIRVFFSTRELHALRESFNNQMAKSRGVDKFKTGRLLFGPAELIGSRPAGHVTVAHEQGRGISTQCARFFDWLGGSIDVESGMRRVTDMGEENRSISWEQYWLLTRQCEKRIGSRTWSNRESRKAYTRILGAVRKYSESLPHTPLVTMSLEDHRALSSDNYRDALSVAKAAGVEVDEFLLSGEALKEMYERRYGNRNINVKPSEEWWHYHDEEIDRLLDD